MERPWIHRTLVSAAKFAIFSATTTTIIVMVTPPFLGFTASGIAAGSLAAAIQSVFYGAAVPAGSLFSIMQSIGAIGVFLPAIAAGLSAGTLCAVTRIVVGAIARVYQFLDGRMRERLLELLRALVAMGALTALDLQRIVGQGRQGIAG
ncbi:hypothetical protein RHS02_08936, partial [Rhizoctonia solani]